MMTLEHTLTNKRIGVSWNYTIFEVEKVGFYRQAVVVEYKEPNRHIEKLSRLRNQFSYKTAFLI